MYTNERVALMLLFYGHSLRIVVVAAFITVIVAAAAAGSRCHNMATFSLRMNRCKFVSFMFLCLCDVPARLTACLLHFTGYPTAASDCMLPIIFNDL